VRVVILNGKRLQMMACCYCVKMWHIFIVYLLFSMKYLVVMVLKDLFLK